MPSVSQCSHLYARLGMWPMAAESWEALYSRPLPTLLCTLAAMVLAHASYGDLFLGGVPWDQWSVIIPEAGLMCCGLYLFMGIYLCGPRINRMPWTVLCTVTSTPCLLYLSMAPYVGGMAIIPYRSRAATAIVMSAGIFGFTVIGQVLVHEQKSTGGPKLALERALVASVVATIRGMNNVTDFGFVRLLVEQVRSSLLPTEFRQALADLPSSALHNIHHQHILAFCHNFTVVS